MDTTVALGVMGGFLLLVGALVARIPVRCPHAIRCAECELAAERENLEQERLVAEMDHRWHGDPVPGCRRCFPHREH